MKTCKRIAKTDSAILQTFAFTTLKYHAIKDRRNIKGREKRINLLAKDRQLIALAEKVGITGKAVEKHLARLKADGIIERIGPAKGGWWRVI